MKHGAVSEAAERRNVRRLQQQPHLRRRLHFVLAHLGAFDPIDRISGHVLTVAEVLEERRKRRQPIVDRPLAQTSPDQLLPPRDDVRPGDLLEVFRGSDSELPGKLYDPLGIGLLGLLRD